MASCEPQHWTLKVSRARQLSGCGWSAGVEGSVIVGKLLEGPGGTYGYNAATNEYEDMVKAGIIDPLKVRWSIQQPANVLLSASAAIGTGWWLKTRTS